MLEQIIVKELRSLQGSFEKKLCDAVCLSNSHFLLKSSSLSGFCASQISKQ